MVYCRYLCLIFVGLLEASAFAKSIDTAPKSLRLLLKEIDYIRTDYPNALKFGEIVDADEYHEMQEFAQSAVEQFSYLKAGLKILEKDNIDSGLAELNQAINNKEDHETIVQITKKLNSALVAAFDIQSAPTQDPKLSLAKETYASNCASCHGALGKGDGLVGASLDPKPRNFHDADVLKFSSPFKFYNIMKTGISGTAMISYESVLEEDQLWGLAFYMAGIKFEEQNKGKTPVQIWQDLDESDRKQLLDKGLNKSMLASMDNNGLINWLKENISTFQLKEDSKWINVLRSAAPYLDIVALDPTIKDKESKSDVGGITTVNDGINNTLSYLGKAREAFIGKQNYEAVQYLMEAYLLGFEKVEVRIGLVDKSIVTDIEKQFIAIRSYAKQKDSALFFKSLDHLERSLLNAQNRYSSQFSSKIGIEEHWRDFTSAFVIILREGFEAFLIVSALLALLNGVGEIHAKRWVHLGWLSAIVMGFVSYYLFNMVIQLSGAAKETVEAVSTGVAVILLFYTGFWLLNQAEQKKWSSFVKEKTKTALSSGRLWGLFTISFVAVYREAAETVLFYSALYNNAHNVMSIGFGFMAGCLVLLSICFAMVRFNKTLSIRKFFMTTSFLMVAISIILTGKTVREMIEAGYFLSTPIQGFPSIDSLGLYPIVETIAAQLFLLVIGLCVAFILLRNRRLPSRP